MSACSTRITSSLITSALRISISSLRSALTASSQMSRCVSCSALSCCRRSALAYARLRGRDPRRALFAGGDTITAELQHADEERQRRRVEQQGHHDDAGREQDQELPSGKGCAGGGG